MNQIAITWSPERVKQLRALHAADKLSTLEMAAKMGVTKNALIGKLSRLGLCKPENNPITNKEVQQRWLQLLNKKDKTRKEEVEFARCNLLRILCSDAFFSTLVAEVKEGSPLSTEDMLSLMVRDGFLHPQEKMLWLKVFEPGDD